MISDVPQDPRFLTIIVTGTTDGKEARYRKHLLFLDYLNYWFANLTPKGPGILRYYDSIGTTFLL